MPKQVKEMGALEVKRLTHPDPSKGQNHFVAVGGVAGLVLQLLPGGGRTWLLRTNVAGKRKHIGLGGYPEVTLAQARDRAREAKEKIRRGIDPVEERRALKAQLAAESARSLLFSDALDRWIAAKLADRPEKSKKGIRSMVTRYALPELGAMTVQDIGTQDVLRALQAVWTEKPETGQKLRNYLENILSWATVAGHRTGENPARWGGNLKELLPAPSVTEKDKGNFPALAVQDAPAWWAEVSKLNGMGALALRFAALCASRSGEVRGAVWDEIDLRTGIWTIPATRMKAGREHRVPLSPAALEILKAVPRMMGVPYVFPSMTGKQMSDMTLSKVMRDMQERAEKAAGGDPSKAGWRDPRSGRPAVPHGLRSTFRDWTAERGVDRDLAEISLAHAVGSEVERAYRRTDMIERRRALLVKWSDFLNGREAAAQVIPIHHQKGII